MASGARLSSRGKAETVCTSRLHLPSAGAARECFRTSLQLNRQNAATMHAWGVLEWRCGHTQAARQLFEKALNASPSNRYVTLHEGPYGA